MDLILLPQWYVTPLDLDITLDRRPLNDFVHRNANRLQEASVNLSLKNLCGFAGNERWWFFSRASARVD